MVEISKGEDLPAKVLSALTDPDVEKWAFNASFERICIGKYFNLDLDRNQWYCTQTLAQMYGLPASLDQVAKVLELEEQKDTAGKFLINYFSKPCKPTKANQGRTRNYWHHDEGKWALFVKYCKQDVATERAIHRYLESHYTKKLDSEWENYHVSEAINDRGVLIDTDLCLAVVEYNNTARTELLARMNELTGLDNSNSLTQLKPWLESRGVTVSSITKDTLPVMMEETDDPDVKEVLRIRKALSLTSVTKYQKMLDAVCSDGRVHGIFKFYGANRTGRFAGRIIQPQNYPRNYMHELDAVRRLVKAREWDWLESEYDIQDVFKQLLRTAIVAPEGCLLSVADYSAIEARVIAWLAHETWAEEEFHGRGKIYEATAAQMFGVPIETIRKGAENYELRQRGKVATLACGYGGGPAAMEAMDVGHKIDPEEYPELVQKWRDANPNICRLWTKYGNAAKRAICNLETVKAEAVTFRYKYGCLFVQLPSKRWLTYYQTKYEDDIGHGDITYAGTDNTAKMIRLKTWGGKITENIVQAVARDCLTDSLKALNDAGFRVIAHIHDEIICEVPADKAEEYLKRQSELMSQGNGVWDDGLYHPAPGYLTPYYLKD